MTIKCQARKLTVLSTGPTNPIICVEVIANVLARSKFLLAQHKSYQLLVVEPIQVPVYCGNTQHKLNITILKYYSHGFCQSIANDGTQLAIFVNGARHDSSLRWLFQDHSLSNMQFPTKTKHGLKRQ